MFKLSRNAAIAQPVERILGKDEVASSNLASSSKPLNLLEVQGFSYFCIQNQTASFYAILQERMRSICVRKLTSPHIFLHL